MTERPSSAPSETGSALRLEGISRDLLDAAPDGIVVVDGEGCVVFVNIEAQRMFGYERDQMIGSRVEQLLPERFRALHGRHREAYASGPRLRPMGAGLDLVARRSNGVEFPVEISLSPLHTADGLLVIASVRDITERKDLESQKAEAEQRARAAAEASLQMRAETERLKDDLTNMVVHDLKNPVNGILMMVQLSLRKGTDLSETHQQRLRQIEMTCGEMTRLIQNLLEISKMEDGKMPIARERVAVAEIVDEVVQEYAPVAEQMARRLQVRNSGGPVVALGDRGLIKRVVVNLVVNALRHSGSTEVWLEISADPQRRVATLRVIDQGRGIREEDRERIFEKFAVIRRSIGDPSGDTGLGLPFCKLAVERMGGAITLQSGQAETVFAVTIPTATCTS
jgi:PAS domain S-box-containing protein